MDGLTLTITKDLGYFAASHNLPNHAGGCANLHGHNYGVKVTVAGRVNDDSSSTSHGMLIDFSHIKSVYKARIHSVLDHAHIVGINQPQWYKTFVSLMSEIGRENPQKAVDDLLGKVVHLPIEETTAELLCAWIFIQMNTGIKDLLKSFGYDENAVYVVSVELSETESSVAKVERKS